MRYKDMTKSRRDARFLDDLGDLWSHVQNLAMTMGMDIYISFAGGFSELFLFFCHPDFPGLDTLRLMLISLG